MATLAEAAEDIALLEVGRKAVEDVLIECRDDRISLLNRGNGLVIREKDGKDSHVIRMGTENALRIALRAMAKAENTASVAVKDGEQMPERRWETRVVEPTPTELLNELWQALYGGTLGARPEPPRFWWNKALERVRELAGVPAKGMTLVEMLNAAADNTIGNPGHTSLPVVHGLLREAASRIKELEERAEMKENEDG